MLIVLVILGLTLGIVLLRGPAGSKTLDIRAAASDVAEALRLARAEAIRTDRPVTFRLDPAHHRFSVGQVVHELPASLDLSLVSVAGGPPGIGFAPDGSSTGGRVELARGGQGIAVGVDWISGRVTTVVTK